MTSRSTFRSLRRFLAGAALAVSSLALLPTPAHAEKIREIADVFGARENQLVGFGLVTGLPGTGDDQSSKLTAQSTSAMLKRLGIQVDQLRMKNVAAVIVTATLPAFAKPGTKIDVTVSSIGNARSLSGGTLVQSLLKGADQKTYAVAQGSLIVGGFSAGGTSGSSLKSGAVNAGRIPEGALVEREVPTKLVKEGKLLLSLRTPSFGTATRVAAAISKELGEGTAQAADGGTIIVTVPKELAGKTVELVAKIEDLDVTQVKKARVVVSEKNGTIVASGDVRLSGAVVVHGNLTIVVREQPAVSQPVLGKGTVVPNSDVQADEQKAAVHLLQPSANLADVAKALGALGLSSRELASVLSALKTAGALDAEVVVQ
jgi:flagellar P-ring protein FlgI